MCVYSPIPTEGSGSYGGNQDEETGEVWVRGNEFLLPSEGEHFSFLFKIKEPSLVKVTIWGAHEEDFQMTLYESESAVDIKTVSKVLNVDRAYPVTSLFVSLAPTESIERPFVLDIEVKDRSKSPQCAYFSFDFAISSEEDKALLFPCPLLFSGAQLPLDNTTPKNYLEVSSGDVLTFPLDGYSLSKVFFFSFLFHFFYALLFFENSFCSLVMFFFSHDFPSGTSNGFHFV